MRPSAGSNTMKIMVKKTILALVCVAAFSMISCDDQDSASADLAAVERELAAIHPGGSASAPPQRRAEIYTKSVPRLQTVARSGTPAQQSAAQLLISRVESGLAQIAATNASEMERRLLDDATRLRASFDLAQASSSFAEALSMIDTAPELAQLDQTLAELDARVADTQTARATLQKENGRLEALAASHLKEADVFRIKAGELRTQALDASAAEAAELSKKAYALQREGGGHEVESAEYLAQTEKVKPLIAEQDLILKSLQEERSHLVDTRSRIEQRGADAQQSELSARADARTATKQAGEILDNIETIRSGDLAAAWASAVQHASNASAAIAKARSLERSAAAISKGDAQQRLGEIHLAMAHSMERYLDLIQALQDADPSSTLASQFASIQSRVQAELGQTQGQVRDAFGQAVSAYQSASVSDQNVRDRLGRISQTLAALAGEPIENDSTTPVAN